MTMLRHRDLVGVQVHQLGYRQSGDPGAVGAGKVWHDTDDDKIYIRNQANSGWVSMVLVKLGQFFVPASSFTASLTSGAAAPVQVESATNKQNVWYMDFADGATKYAEIVTLMPTDYDGGTMTARFLWGCASAVVTVVRWQIEARSYADLETIDQAFGTAVAVDDAFGNVANQIAFSAATAAVTAAGTPAAGELMHIRIARLGAHANDTMTQDARLVGMRIDYTRT